MKKIVSIFTLAAFFFAAAVSCTKEADVPAEEQGQEEEVTPVNPAEPGEDENLPEGMIRLTFSLSSENDSPAGPAGAPASRTSWDGSTQSWTDGDHIRIIWGEGDVEGTDYVDAEVVSGTVSAVVADSDYYYAVYPTTASYTYTAAEGKVTITVPRYQTGNFSDANIMAAKTGKAEASFAFKNMTSILKFSTGSGYSYNSASFMTNDKSVKLTGEVATTFPGEFAVNTTNESMKEDIVCIQPNNPAGNAGLTANTTYYLAMLPGAAIANGIGFKIETRSGSSVDLVAGGLSKSSFSRERAHVYDLGTLDSRIITDWYISESGTGDGNLEADPAGRERLMDLLNPSYSASNTTAGWRLANATIHVAPGTYNLQALNGGEVFDPHYNLSGLVAHIKGEGTALNPTRFVCNETDGDRIFALTETHRVGNFTFENITFTATNSSATDGIAFYLTSTGKTANEHNVITFKDCTFTGLTSTVSSGSAYGGAAVNIYDSADFDVVFNGCTFSGNTAGRGGAVALTNGGENSNVNFTNCIFSDNAAVAETSNQGGAVYVYDTGKTTFDNTSFTGDGSTSTAINGGAIAIIAGATVTLRNGCSFTGCVTNGNGGAILNHGTLVVDNSSFTSCKGKHGGAIWSDATATIQNGSVLSNNIGETDAGAVFASNGTVNLDASTVQGDGSTVNAPDAGGIWVASDATVNLTGGTIVKQCKASAQGGGVKVFGTLNVYDGCKFIDNVAANGGAIHGNDASYTYVKGATFTGNSATNGGAIRLAGAADKLAKAVIFNSLFDGNAGSGTGTQGGTINESTYSRALIANSTIRNHSGESPLTITGGASGTYSYMYAISCTFAENSALYTRNYHYMYFINSIATNGVSTANPGKDYSILGDNRYGSAKAVAATVSGLGAACLKTFDTDHYPLNSTYSEHYSAGVSVENLQSWTLDNLTLTDAQKALLAADQKGNPRGGTIMGAYVLTD